MKRLTFLLLFIPCLCTAQLSIHIGDSPIKGNIGIEYRYQNFAISSSYRPAKCYNLDWFHSFSGAITYFYDYPLVTIYARAGYASKLVYKGSDYNYITAPSGVASLGVRYFPYKVAPMITKRLSFDIGAGIFASRYGSDWFLDIALNINLFKNR